MAETILSAEGLHKTFGALAATDGVSLGVREGETHAIIGPNGAGKTTLISQLAGNLRPDAGRVRRQPIARRIPCPVAAATASRFPSR